MSQISINMHFSQHSKERMPQAVNAQQALHAVVKFEPQGTVFAPILGATYLRPATKEESRDGDKARLIAATTDSFVQGGIVFDLADVRAYESSLDGRPLVVQTMLTRGPQTTNDFNAGPRGSSFLTTTDLYIDHTMPGKPGKENLVLVDVGTPQSYDAAYLRLSCYPDAPPIVEIAREDKKAFVPLTGTVHIQATRHERDKFLITGVMPGATHATFDVIVTDVATLQMTTITIPTRMQVVK